MNKKETIDKLRLLHQQHLKEELKTKLNSYYEISKDLHSTYINLLKNIIITFGNLQKWNKHDHLFDLKRYIINEDACIKLSTRNVEVDNNYGDGTYKNSAFDCVSIFYVENDSRNHFHNGKCFAYIYVYGDTEEVPLDDLTLDDLMKIYEYFTIKFNLI